MSLTELFKKIDAPLANQRWSWGSVRPDGSVVLRVWQDRKEKINGKWHMMVAHHEKYTDNEENLGYQERLDHIARVKNGANCYMIMCLAKDPAATPRSIKSFNEKDVFVGENIIEHEGNTFIELVDRYPISNIT
jgi:hypothetical protein